MRLSDAVLLAVMPTGCGPEPTATVPRSPSGTSTEKADPAPSHVVAATAQEDAVAGGAVLESLSTEIGSLRPTWSACILPVQGASLSFALQPQQPATTAYLMEVEETHLRRDLPPAVVGRTGFFLKMVLSTSPADQRLGVESLRAIAD